MEYTMHREIFWGAVTSGALFVAGCMGYAPEPHAPGNESASVSLPNQATTSVPQQEPICQLLDRVLDATLQQRRLNAETHAAWQVMHGVMAYGWAFPLEVGGQTVSALEYLFAGRPLAGWQFELGDATDPQTGRPGLRATVSPGSQTAQGHPDQWLGYLATCGVPAEQPLRVNGEVFTVADLIRQVEWDVPRNFRGEYTWTLMGLSSYRPSNHTWVAADGHTWSMERLVEVELQQDRDSSACGGTHRLYGLALALNRHLTQGGQLTGAWAEADKAIGQAVQAAHAYQNPDGSFSPHYFARPGKTSDAALTLSTTGHVFEFLAVALDGKQVRAEWVERAARRLCQLLELTSRAPLDCGALYHAAHGLVLYRERVCGPRQYSLPGAPTAER